MAGGFKNFLASDKGTARLRKKELEGIKRCLEQGSYLSTPMTDGVGGNVSINEYKGATISIQGWRVSNEDKQTVKEINGDELFMGVYDGHGGDAVSKILESKLHNAVEKTTTADEESLKTTFEQLDLEIRSVLDKDASATGSTCNVCILTSDQIICANSGDCRAVLSRGDEVIPLSIDHIPDLENETKRILKSGLTVTNGRVSGMLNLSRAFGDFDLKDSSLAPADQGITASCDVTTFSRMSNDNFIIQACDGIWGARTNEEVVSFVQKRLSTEDPYEICHSLCKDILAPTADAENGTDNMTINLILL